MGLEFITSLGVKSDTYHTNTYAHSDIIKTLFVILKTDKNLYIQKSLFLFSRVFLVSGKSFPKCWPHSELSKASFRKFLKSYVWISSVYCILPYTAVTVYHRPGALNNRNLCHSSGGWKSKIKAPSNSVPGEGLLPVTFSMCSHVAPLCVGREGATELLSVSY